MNGVFQSVGQALHVAYLMEILPVTQQGSTQRMIDWLKREAGIPPERGTGGNIDFGGLQPHEVRGQCAMVRGAVEHHLPGPERDAVWARYGHQLTRSRGVDGLSSYLQALTTVRHDLAMRALVWSVVHPGERAQDKWSLRAIAEETGESVGKLQRAGVIVREQSKALRNIAEGRLQALFERTGLVADVDALEAA